MEEEKLAIGQVAKIVGRTIETLRNWHETGTFVPKYVLNNRRIYTRKQVDEFMKFHSSRKNNVPNKKRRPTYLSVVSIIDEK